LLKSSKLLLKSPFRRAIGAGHGQVAARVAGGRDARNIGDLRSFR